jgi:3-deoxy-D-manno-octulosonic-acid transferase
MHKPWPVVPGMNHRAERVECPFLMYWLYTTLLAIGLLVSLPYWLFQGWRHGKYRAGLGERLGQVPARLAENPLPAIWVHAVSVGEVLAIVGLVGELRSRFPQYRVVVSTTTDTGQKLARARFGESSVFYFPLDFGFAIRPYLRRLRPALVVIAETEFWPNFLRLVRASGARIAVVNARISDRSWPGYRRWRFFLARVLRPVDLFLAQTETDRKRLLQIGAPASRIHVSGNLKFDAAPPAPLPIVATLRGSFQNAGAGPILVCGSTVDGEEALLVRAFEAVLAQHARAVMLLAPRHPERFQEVAQLLGKSSVRFWRRSQWKDEGLAGGVLLLDSIGELAALYALGDLAFVGGSLVPRGGHNILEPAQQGIPIIVGEHTENFRDIVESFRSRDAVCIVAPEELAPTFLALAADEAERKLLSQRATEVLGTQIGATQRTLQALEELLEFQQPIRERERSRSVPLS